MKKFLTAIAICGVAAATAFGTACSGTAKDMDGMAPENDGYLYDENIAGETGEYGESYVYGSVLENGFTEVADQSSSYFSLDRNTANYSQVRYMIDRDSKVYKDSVRIEELINYFDYDFEAPENGAVKVSGYLSDCPWNEEHKLMLAGIKTVEKSVDSVNGNYVFLIDVSGSMSGDSRLGLAKKGLKMLLENLGEGDKVSIVTYASGVSKVLDGGECDAKGKKKIENAIDKLKAGGATYASGGLQMAYEVAEKHYISDGNNRVIIISDGDFNVGISNKDEMMEYISARTVAEKSVYLSVLGVGMGNMRDDMLETLATCGNGNYAYLDNETEAEKIFCHELNGTLMTVAKDAKAGVTFEDTVVKYRLIGYDTKIMSKDEFNDPTTDAGELGSNLCVAALYEIELAEGAEGKLAEIEIRYKDVTGGAETDESATAVIECDTPSSDDLSFISCVAEFGLVLRQSKYAENADINSVIERLGKLNDYISKDSYRQSFVTLAGKAGELYSK